MRIAVVGGGISGMVAAHLLCQDQEIVLFEAADRVGGHTNTEQVELDGRVYPVNTGFIVFNEVTYPLFCRLLDRLGVASQESTMSFSVRCERTGLEYNPNSLRKLFAQRKNLLSPSFHRMILEILRFRRAFERVVEEEPEGTTLGAYLEREGYSHRFVNQFILPLGSAVWSADPEAYRDFPMRYFARFFLNHGFLRVRNPFAWRVLRGGSARYAEKLTAPYADRIRLGSPVRGIRGTEEHVEVRTDRAGAERFDHVILATHSDQALALLEDPSPAEREVLGAIPYQENHTLLHTDSSILPTRHAVRASWNSLLPRRKGDRSIVTYSMNRLQGLDAPQEICVSLNAGDRLDPARVLRSFAYHHPVYTVRAPAAQARHGEVSGVNRTHYCGAYWGYGFHEDGVRSALAACAYFGKGL